MNEFTAGLPSLDLPNPRADAAELTRSPATSYRSARVRRHVLPLIERIHRKQGSVRILDIGGAAPYWRSIASELDSMNCSLTLLNVDERSGVVEALGEFGSSMSFEQGDARGTQYSDGAFDFVHSNSVIEHVGMWGDMRAMAAEIRRLAPSYFVQTPNFWFPFEPHYRKPFFHWLPEQMRAHWLMRRGSASWPQAPSMLHATDWIQRTYLLSYGQMAALFPDGTIKRERIYGITKSLMAQRVS